MTTGYCEHPEQLVESLSRKPIHLHLRAPALTIVDRLSVCLSVSLSLSLPPSPSPSLSLSLSPTHTVIQFTEGTTSYTSIKTSVLTKWPNLCVLNQQMAANILTGIPHCATHSLFVPDTLLYHVFLSPHCSSSPTHMLSYSIKGSDTKRGLNVMLPTTLNTVVPPVLKHRKPQSVQDKVGTAEMRKTFGFRFPF